jgi:hypothetical protein
MSSTIIPIDVTWRSAVQHALISSVCVTRRTPIKALAFCFAIRTSCQVLTMVLSLRCLLSQSLRARTVAPSIRRFHPTAAKMTEHLTGRCVCGSLKYSLDLKSADDARTTLCHCQSCKRAFGTNYGVTTKVCSYPSRSVAGQDDSVEAILFRNDDY